MTTVNRRQFMQLSTMAGLGVASAINATAQDKYVQLKKGVQWGKLPKEATDADKVKIAKAVGFNGIEGYPMADLEAAKRLGDLAREGGVPIHSITYGGWKHPMSSPDQKVISEGKAAIENALRTAHAVGADVMLLVPAVVNEQVSYGMAWENSQKNIKSLIPLAEELKVTIAVENVWNKFLLSPLEFARYVDEFENPRVKAYFDIGNVIIFGYSQDWIRTLGPRIARLHIKDFKRSGYQWCKLPYEGDVNWVEVRKAVAEINYEGWVTEEFPYSDEKQLRELVRRMQLFSDGAASA